MNIWQQTAQSNLSSHLSRSCNKQTQNERFYYNSNQNRQKAHALEMEYTQIISLTPKKQYNALICNSLTILWGVIWIWFNLHSINIFHLYDIKNWRFLIHATFSFAKHLRLYMGQYLFNDRWMVPHPSNFSTCIIVF